MTEPQRVIAFGPLFTAALLAFVYGLIRRRPLFAGLGIGLALADQFTPVGRALTERLSRAGGGPGDNRPA